MLSNKTVWKILVRMSVKLEMLDNICLLLLSLLSGKKSIKYDLTTFFKIQFIFCSNVNQKKFFLIYWNVSSYKQNRKKKKKESKFIFLFFPLSTWLMLLLQKKKIKTKASSENSSEAALILLMVTLVLSIKNKFGKKKKVN